MDLIDATRMIEAESAAFPDLVRVTHDAADQFAAGRQVHYSTISWMIREACRRDLYGALIRKHGQDTFEDMVTVLCREIDRQAPVPSR